MSWTKRPQGAPGTTQESAPYAQQYDQNVNQRAMYQSYSPNTSTAVPQQYWQMPYSPDYQRAEYAQNNANQIYQYNPEHDAGQPAVYQHNYYQTRGPQGCPERNRDGWEDNWDWGWEEKRQTLKNANNTDVIEESFTKNDSSWNWTGEESNRDAATSAPAETRTRTSESEPLVRTLNDRDTVREKFPNLASGRRLNADLTPQWSIESQMSQDSTDHTRSESTYRSGNESRNSNKSSDEREWSRHASRAAKDDVSHEELTNTLRELNIENPVPESDQHIEVSADTVASSMNTATCSPSDPTTVPNSSHASDAARFNRSLPVPPPADPSRSSPSSPLTSTRNPFKHSTAFSHKPRSHSPDPAGASPVPADETTRLGSLAGYSTANLETAPDNSERPDQPPNALPFHPPPPRPPPENLEVAPRNERNEYLQTAHLSTSVGYNDNRDAPPPGLRRTVVGRQEAGYTQSRASEEPPPGLSRMVPGQQTESAGDAYMDRRIDGQPTDLRNPFRQADGRQTADSFRPSRNAYNDERIVTGVDAAEYDAPDIEQRREVTMEGENLQDLSAMSSTDICNNRTQNAVDNPVCKTDMSDSLELPPGGSRRQSLNRINTSGEESERDRTFKSSPRRDRGRAREDRKYEGERRRDDRRDKESRRRDRDGSPGGGRHRRADRRYETEDTDYYSDRERERRRYREGSYTSSKPPRHDDKERRHRDERDRNRRYNTTERDAGRRNERRYRDIDPTRKYGDQRRQEEDRRRGEEPLSSEWSADGGDRRRRRRHHDSYFENYGGYSDAYLMQRQQYQYYEHLRLTNPTAYLEIYNKLMAGRTRPVISDDMSRMAPLYTEGYGSVVGEDRGSVHSGRSSINNNTDLNTDASLSLQLEESTVRSDRMTPFKYSTAHIKGVISSRNIVLVRPSYPVDGSPARVEILDLRSARRGDDECAQIERYPGPLIKGVTHKRSVVEYCLERGLAAREKRVDPVGASLIWELLALMLRQNGSVLGADIAELLVKSQRELSCSTTSPETSARDAPSFGENADSSLERYRRYLMVGDTQQALECAMSDGLWGHALSLSLWDRRVRSTVLSRFMSSLSPTDPLLTLYTNAANRQPPAAKAVGDERWGDWRPHLAILLANPSARPDVDRKTVVQMGDSLRSRGLPHSAQFCYLAAEEEFAPPRSPLLLWNGEGSAPDEAVFATEIYEYARGVHGPYALPGLQEYKLALAGRMCDCGQYARALALVEALAEVLAADPQLYPRRLLAQTAGLADRLRYQEPSAADEEEVDSGESAPGTPRRGDWIRRLRLAADAHAVRSDPAPPTPTHATPERVHEQTWEQMPSPVTLDAADSPQYETSHRREEETRASPSYHYGEERSGGPQPESEPARDLHDDAYWNGEREASAPSISLPGAAAANRPTLYDEPEEDARRSPASANERKEETASATKGGWFGGIFTKLSLRAPNQMILPDDKNPSIVWDSENKRWKNVNGEDETSASPPPPPPIAAVSSAAPVSNIFKMQKGRHIKKSYVDVFNQHGAGRPLPPAAEVLGPPVPSVPALGDTGYFVPDEVRYGRGE